MLSIARVFLKRRRCREDEELSMIDVSKGPGGSSAWASPINRDRALHGRDLKDDGIVVAVFKIQVYGFNMVHLQVV